MRVSPQGLVWSFPDSGEDGPKEHWSGCGSRTGSRLELCILYIPGICQSSSFLSEDCVIGNYLLDGCILGEKAYGLVPARPRGLGMPGLFLSLLVCCLAQSGGLVSTPRTHRHTIPPSFQRFFQLQSTCGFLGDSSLAGVGLPAALVMD